MLPWGPVLWQVPGQACDINEVDVNVRFQKRFASINRNSGVNDYTKNKKGQSEIWLDGWITPGPAWALVGLANICENVV